MYNTSKHSNSQLVKTQGHQHGLQDTRNVHGKYNNAGLIMSEEHKQMAFLLAACMNPLLTTYLHALLRLRKHGAIPPPSHTPPSYSA